MSREQLLHERRVAHALDEHRALTLNEMCEECGGTISATSHALMVLEGRGEAVLFFGRWSRGVPAPAPHARFHARRWSR